MVGILNAMWGELRSSLVFWKQRVSNVKIGIKQISEATTTTVDAVVVDPTNGDEFIVVGLSRNVARCTIGEADLEYLLSSEAGADESGCFKISPEDLADWLDHAETPAPNSPIFALTHNG